MSHTTFYGVRKDGSTQALMTQRNSWLYGYRVWEELWKRYCPETNPDAIKYGYSTMMSNTPASGPSITTFASVEASGWRSCRPSTWCGSPRRFMARLLPAFVLSGRLYLQNSTSAWP